MFVIFYHYIYCAERRVSFRMIDGTELIRNELFQKQQRISQKAEIDAAGDKNLQKKDEECEFGDVQRRRPISRNEAVKTHNADAKNNNSYDKTLNLERNSIKLQFSPTVEDLQTIKNERKRQSDIQPLTPDRHSPIKIEEYLNPAESLNIGIHAEDRKRVSSHSPPCISDLPANLTRCSTLTRSIGYNHMPLSNSPGDGSFTTGGSEEKAYENSNKPISEIKTATELEGSFQVESVEKFKTKYEEPIYEEIPDFSEEFDSSFEQTPPFQVNPNNQLSEPQSTIEKSPTLPDIRNKPFKSKTNYVIYFGFFGDKKLSIILMDGKITFAQGLENLIVRYDDTLNIDEFRPKNNTEADFNTRKAHAIIMGIEKIDHKNDSEVKKLLRDLGIRGKFTFWWKKSQIIVEKSEQAPI